jgi:tetratricopeptide (TPR) repeat protein
MLKISRQIRLSAPFATVLMFSLLSLCAGVVVGQSSLDQQPGGPTAARPAENNTRARRIHESGKADPVESPETVSQPSASQSAANESLREQIAAAKTPAEQTRLQLLFVDQLLDSGMKKEAATELRAMAAEDRFDPPSFFNLGNRFVRLGDFEAAVTTYHKAIDQRNGNYSRALNNLGAVLLRLGRWDEAQEVLLTALRLEKFRYAEASFNLGRLYSLRGENDLAIREWQRALVTDPQHSGAARALANVRSEGRVRVSPVDNQLAPARLGESTQARNFKKSETVTNSKGNVTGRPLAVDQMTYMMLQQARNARDRGRHEEATLYYRNVLSRTGGYFAPANLELAYSLISLRRTDEAIASLLPVVTIDGERYPICYYHLARLYEMQGRLKLAEENYNQAAIAYAGRNPQFTLDLSRVREKLGDFSGALAALELYVQAAEKVGPKLNWSDARVAELRQKIEASSASTTAKP